MKLLLGIFIISSTLLSCHPAGLQNNVLAGNRQGGISFIIPGLSLLGGGGNNAGIGGGAGGLFGTVTTTRTIISTVSTVTTASFRTCLAPTGNLMPCVPGPAAGRKRRGADLEENVNVKIAATPTVQLIIGATTITDPIAVAEYLESHKPSTQSVIYPKDVEAVQGNSPMKINPRFEIGETTALYPSHDTPEESEDSEIVADAAENSVDVTTETPTLTEDSNDNTGDQGSTGTETPQSDLEELKDFGEKARNGIRRTVTTTSVIRVTGIANSLASGPMATVMITYGGCLPNPLPISAAAC